MLMTQHCCYAAGDIDNIFITAHTNADYNSLCFCSDPKGKDTKV